MASEPSLPLGSSGVNTVAPDDETTIVVPVRRRRRRWPRILLVVLLVLVLAGAGSALAFYENPPLLIPVGGMLLGTQPGAVAWNGTDPLNILVMGIDQRTTEVPHSDSMILLHVDPATKDVSMLSVPRDLYVNIPINYGWYKINAAYSLGYDPKAPMQGAQFAQLEVQNALHVPINYFAVIRFAGFKDVVDALGGVTVCVPHELNDPLYPADVGNGYHPIDIKAGCQHMDGTTALEYARERHANVQEDLGRIQQQQALLDGIEKGLLSPRTVLNLPAILAAIDGAVITDLPHSALLELGLLMSRAKGAHTHHYYINVDGGYVTGTVMDGQDVLAGNWPRIWGLVSQVAAEPQVQAEHATVQVRNGQHQVGLAAMYSALLQSAGFNTVAPRDADMNTYTQNLVIVNQDLPGADYTARLLAQMFQARMDTRHLGTDHAQIVLILGSDVAEGQ